MSAAAILALALLACGPSRARPGSGGEFTGDNPPTCAAAYADVPQGQACGDGQESCAYPEGTCSCAPQRYCGGPPPPQELLDQLAIPVWQCKPFRTDGCPETPPSGACRQDGKVCSYDNCCITEITCQDGNWTQTRDVCPP